MSSSPDVVVLRKELLLARASLQRLKLRHEIDGFRESLRWPNAVGAIAASPKVRSLTFALLLAVAGRWRVARLVRGAAIAVVVARLALRAFTRSAKPAGEPPPPPQQAQA